MKYFFTADEHFGHENIIKYCNRPFRNVEEMNKELIKRFNSVVSEDDVTYHLGDFTLKNREIAHQYIDCLKGKHIFVKGSHDYWAEKDNLPYMIEKLFGKLYLVLCHYPLRSWPRSFHGSINLYGHVHGNDGEYNKQMDVGVDTNNFYPYSLEDIRKKLKI